MRYLTIQPMERTYVSQRTCHSIGSHMTCQARIRRVVSIPTNISVYSLQLQHTSFACPISSLQSNEHNNAATTVCNRTAIKHAAGAMDRLHLMFSSLITGMNAFELFQCSEDFPVSRDHFSVAALHWRFDGTDHAYQYDDNCRPGSTTGEDANQ